MHENEQQLETQVTPEVLGGGRMIDVDIEKEMKKILALVLALSLVFMFASCGNISESYAKKINAAADKGEHYSYDQVVEDLGDNAIEIAILGNGVVIAVKGCESVADIKANEDVDMIVCISHSGTSSNEEESEDEILAKAVPELDLIISGHTHTKLDEPIVHGNTYIVSCAEYGKYFRRSPKSC